MNVIGFKERSHKISASGIICTEITFHLPYLLNFHQFLLISDINECDNPALASRCVANAECCNLPAHFLCKCRPGYEGDGEVQCTGKTFSFQFSWEILL